MKVQKTPCLGGVEVATVGAMDRRPPGPSAAGRWLAILVVAAALVFGVTSCSNDDDDPKGPTATVGTSPPTSKPTTSTTTIEDVEAEVEAAYLEAEAAYYEATTAPDPKSPLLSDHRAGDNLDAVKGVMERLADDGVVVQFGPNGPPEVTVLEIAVEPDLSTAMVRSCIVDDVRQVRRSTGEVVEDSSSSITLTAQLRRRGDRWYIVNARRIDRVAGGDCA